MRSVELGLRFQSSVDGQVDAVTFFRQVPIHRGYTAHVWTEKGELLGSARSVEGQQPTPGWQTVQFWPPIPIKAGSGYVASYHADFGQYSVSKGFFTDRPVESGMLRTSGGRDSGVYAYGDQVQFPTTTGAGSNYWVDVSFKPTARQK